LSSDICYSDGKFNVFSSITKDIRNNRSYEISERIPIIKTFRFDDFTSFVQPDSNIIVEAINSFLQEPSQKLCEIIQGELKIYLQSMKICVYSEYVFSSMFFKYLAEACYKNKWKDIIIFSIDSKMEIISDTLTTEKKINNIRCDLILICNNKLYIFEYKYRYDRYNSQADDALKCIKDRGYRYHVAEHLQRHYSDIYNKIESIVLVGMGYSYFKEKVNCEMKYELVNLPI
jgi:hypothetical protein